MVAEVIATAGHSVTVYDRMPSMGRKLLMAGRGGLNLTHSEAMDRLVERYGAAAPWLAPTLAAFPPSALRDWCLSLGQPTFVGTSGRVFPVAFKASPLLRAWLQRLDRLGVGFVTRHRWVGWDEADHLLFLGPDQRQERVRADATVLALGGASWPRLGSDGLWVPILSERQVPLTPLRPSNCGFVVPWSDLFRQRFEGQPLKPLTITFGETTLRGELVITAGGLEGGAVYALSPLLREAIARDGRAIVTLDLRPGLTHEELARRLGAARGSRSLSTILRTAGGLSPVAVSLIREATRGEAGGATAHNVLASTIKALALTLTAPAPIERAISTAGGVALAGLDEHFMLRAMPGVFAAGEMLDWEAPTGGYLLQGTFSTAVAAARGVLNWLRTRS
jgi:uncharacterized flavoprotein (TIGR03862 family)